MMKRVCTAAVVGLALVAGCRSTPVNQVTVTVESDGSLHSEGFALTSADLPAFAKEIGNRPVVVVPFNSPKFQTAVEAKRKLEAAGFRNVTIGG